ncbi:MAG: diacylglycerol/lipid kinase family protein [Ktedonobacteraceae bacterium]
MKCKRACLVINPRAGQNIAKLADVIAVLAAAGWKTDIAIKEYGGHSMELATKAAEEDYDLVIGYGGDGTLNNVVNGVMNVKGQHSIVGVIPGGTANVWAGEVGIPVDPVKAALAIINSEARKVDIGHIEIASLTFPAANDGEQSPSGATNSSAGSIRRVKPTSKAKHHFLLMAGLGIDAAVMSHVSKPLKYKIGPLAVGLSAAKELPSQHPFPVEIHATGGGRNGDVLWKGEAVQVVIGNTRRYADFAEMTPNAHIDDGVLDVCVITAGDPLTTVQQITSLLLRRKPDNLTAEYFHGAHFSLSVPASIDMQLDGSAVKLKDYLSKADRQALQAVSPEHVMVNYRFDAMPRALRVAIPYTYNDELFEDGARKDKAEVVAQQQEDGEKAHDEVHEHHSRHDEQRAAEAQQQALEQVDALVHRGRHVKVIAASPNPAKQGSYIVAGVTPKQSTGEDKPAAVCIDDTTTMSKRTGEQVSSTAIRDLQEGSILVVEGKQSKRGVIRAKRAIIV